MPHVFLILAALGAIGVAAGHAVTVSRRIPALDRPHVAVPFFGAGLGFSALALAIGLAAAMSGA